MDATPVVGGTVCAGKVLLAGRIARGALSNPGVRLLSSRLRKALKAPRRLRMTREGKWFVVMTVIVGAGAINTGNNLLYLLLGMMLGLVILSGVLSELMLQKLVVRRVAAGDHFAGKEGRVVFEVHNLKRFFSSYSIEVVEHESRPTRHRRRRALGLREEPPRARLGGAILDDGDPGPPKALFLRIAPQQRVTASGLHTFTMRGMHEYAGIDLVTRFPFGFFEKTRPIEDPGDQLVYPAIATFDRRALDPGRMAGEVARRVEGRGGEFFGLREFRTGDDRRDVHWKVSARRNQLVRRLYEREDNEAIAVHLCNWLPPELQGDARRDAERALEEAISRCAGVCSHYLERGFRVALQTLGEQVPAGEGAGQSHTILRHLAMLRVRDDAEAPTLRPAELPNRVLIDHLATPEPVRAAFALRVEEGGSVSTGAPDAGPAPSGRGERAA